MSKFTFKGLYNATKEALHTVAEPLNNRRNERAVSAAIDSALEQKMNAEANLEKALLVVSKGEIINVNTILEHKQTIKDAEETIATLEEFKREFFSDEDEETLKSK